MVKKLILKIKIKLNFITSEHLWQNNWEQWSHIVNSFTCLQCGHAGDFAESFRLLMRLDKRLFLAIFSTLSQNVDARHCGQLNNLSLAKA